MKFKLAVLFLILAVVTVAGVFYVKDYFSYDISRPQAAQGQTPSIDGAITAGSQLYDYSDQVYANDDLSKRIMGAYGAGDLVIIHFWASWCAPCVNEIPEIIEFMKKNKAEGGTKAAIQFIAVNLDSSQEDIQKFLKSFPEFNQDPFIRIWDKNSELSKYFDVDKLPASVFLQNGKPYRKSNGAISWLREGN